MKIELEGTWPEIQRQCAQLLGIGQPASERKLILELDGENPLVYSDPRDPAAAERAWSILKEPLAVAVARHHLRPVAAADHAVQTLAPRLSHAGFGRYEIRHGDELATGSLG